MPRGMPVQYPAKEIDWRKDIDRIESQNEVEKVSPYMQGHLLLQNRDYHAVPYSMGIEPEKRLACFLLMNF